MSYKIYIAFFENWVPAKPTILTQNKNFIELSFQQDDERFKLLEEHLLYKVQLKTKVLGWINVYCGGKTSKIIDNIQPGRPHKFRMKVILKSSSVSVIKEISQNLYKDIDKLYTNNTDATDILNQNIANDDLININVNGNVLTNKKQYSLNKNALDENKKNNIETHCIENCTNSNADNSDCVMNVIGIQSTFNAPDENVLNTMINNDTSAKDLNYLNKINTTYDNSVNVQDPKVFVGNTIQLNKEVAGDHIEDITTKNKVILNNDKSLKFIESQWSEEVSACTNSEGPTVACFCMAVRCGYLKQVHSMLEERPALMDICNTTDGFTPLAIAVRKGNVHMVKYLLNAGADVNQRSSTSQMPLHLSILSANISLTEILVERGADTKTRDRNGLTLLHYAVDSNHLPTVIYALNKGNVNARDNKGWTPLFRAVIQGADAEIVQELVDQGSDTEERDHRGLTCAQYASLLKKREDIRRIVDKDFVRIKAVSNFTKLTKKLSTIQTLIHK